MIKALSITLCITTAIVLFGGVLPAMVSSTTDEGPIVAGLVLLFTFVYGIVRLTRKEKK